MHSFFHRFRQSLHQGKKLEKKLAKLQHLGLQHFSSEGFEFITQFSIQMHLKYISTSKDTDTNVWILHQFYLII